MKIQLIYKLTCTRIEADKMIQLSLEAKYITWIGLEVENQISIMLEFKEYQIEKEIVLSQFLLSMHCLLPVGCHLINIETVYDRLIN